jgi:hypothetical protein
MLRMVIIVNGCDDCVVVIMVALVDNSLLTPTVVVGVRMVEVVLFWEESWLYLLGACLRLEPWRCPLRKGKWLLSSLSSIQSSTMS